MRSAKWHNMTSPTLAATLKEIRSYCSTEWELFVEEWLRGLEQKYREVKRLGASGDLGRDVVGFTDDHRLEGVWDNYQCKHFDRPFLPSVAGIEIAKLIYFAFLMRFRVPRKMFFVAPRDVAMELGDLLNSPTQLRAYIQTHWDTGYANNIIEKQSILLTGPIAAYVANFDFSIFTYYQTSEMITDHRKTAHWAERFGVLLPPPPLAVVPSQIQPIESVYLGQLLEVYGEKAGCQFATSIDLTAHPTLDDDHKQQRERFFLAEEFNHHYRDETAPGTVEQFVEDIFDAIDPVVKLPHPNGYDRLNSCLVQAAQVYAGGILAPHARPKTKQGVCHQLANGRRVIWIRS
jgi:hypothetical protein